MSTVPNLVVDHVGGLRRRGGGCACCAPRAGAGTCFVCYWGRGGRVKAAAGGDVRRAGALEDDQIEAARFQRALTCGWCPPALPVPPLPRRAPTSSLPPPVLRRPQARQLAEGWQRVGPHRTPSLQVELVRPRVARAGGERGRREVEVRDGAGAAGKCGHPGAARVREGVQHVLPGRVGEQPAPCSAKVEEQAGILASLWHADHKI